MLDELYSCCTHVLDFDMRVDKVERARMERMSNT